MTGVTAQPEHADLPHVALVGLSGAGKSTVAPLLANRLGARSAVDLDVVVSGQLGRSAEQAFAELGEAAFRQAETDALLSSLAGPPSVIATGGGVVLDADNRAALRARAVVIWLRAHPDHLAARLADSSEARPLLQGDPEFALRRLASEREALYADVADHVVDVEGVDPGDLADELARILR